MVCKSGAKSSITAQSAVDERSVDSAAAPSRTEPTVQHLAGNFVISSGSTLFRRDPVSDELQICILHQTRKKVWVLPKGRKDFGETIEGACLRETYEETGYPCEFVPLRMATRATEPGDLIAKDQSVVRDGMTEPMGVTVQDRGPRKGVKLIMWYVTRVQDGAVKVDGTQMASEHYESHFISAERAIATLSRPQQRELAAQALELVRTTERVLGRTII
jgi:8-oxo-dGTP pyrophosphatase MutT (NUDIX family)